MGKNSKIEWTDHTFNPWIGCQKVSPGCQHCYAEALMDKRMKKARWGPEGTRVRTSAEYWNQPLRWDQEAAMHATRRRVFCASLADVFEDRPELDDWRIDLFDLIGATPHLDWLVLTKRPENITDFLFGPRHGYILGGGDYFPNLWLGTSVEDQARADERIPDLLQAQGGARRFLSMEPLLGPVDLVFCQFVDGPMIQPTRCTIGGKPMPTARLSCIDWVIVGGESGPHARPMHPDWARSIKSQCLVADVPFFFKQWGGWALSYYADLPNSWVNEDTGAVTERTRREIEPPPCRSAAVMKKVGKHAAGRRLDGQEWSQFPE